MQQKRYLVMASFFLYADNDFKLLEKADEIKRIERDNYDNQYEIESIGERPFGSFKNRQLDLDEIRTNILVGSPRAFPEITPERMEGE